jgi:Kef-type K+ transport system membrane component KefB
MVGTAQDQSEALAVQYAEWWASAFIVWPMTVMSAAAGWYALDHGAHRWIAVAFFLLAGYLGWVAARLPGRRTSDLDQYGSNAEWALEVVLLKISCSLVVEVILAAIALGARVYEIILLAVLIWVIALTLDAYIIAYVARRARRHAG